MEWSKNVGASIPCIQRTQNGTQKFTNAFAENFYDEDLKNAFADYGTLTSAVVMKDENGKSKCFDFANFENPKDSANVIEKMNGFTVDDKVWYAGRAQTKSERL